MGMDVYGNNPKSEVGEYFRRNVWGWRPLWGYCEDNHEDIASKVEYGHSNDGDGLNSIDSKKLSVRLKKDIDSGKAQEYIDQRNEMLKSLPLEDCEYCQKTGKRAWPKNHMAVSSVVKNNEQPYEINSDGEIVIDCNGCQGTGSKKSFLTYYYLDLDDIKEFAEFLSKCGGFKIW